MDPEEQTQSMEASWPEMSADLTLARTQARSIVLDTQRASSDGRILEVTAQVELMRTRMAAFEQQVAIAQNEIPAELLEQLDGVDRQLVSTSHTLEKLSQRISATEEVAATSLSSSFDTLSTRLDNVDTESNSQQETLVALTQSIERASAEISKLTESANTNRENHQLAEASHGDHLAAYALQVSAIEKSINEVRSNAETTNTVVEQQLATVNTRFEQETAATNTRLEQEMTTVNTRLEQETAATNIRLEQEMTTVNIRLEEQASEQSTTNDETTATIQFLQRRAASIESTLEQSAAEIIEEIRNTQQRLNTSMAELQLLRTRSASTDDFAELTAVLEAHALEQQRLASLVNNVSESLESRIDLQGTAVAKQQAIMDVSSRLLAEHSEARTQHDAEIKALESGVAQHHQDLVSFSGWSAEQNTRTSSLDSRASKLEAHASQTRKHIEAINDWVTNGDSQISKLQEDGLRGRHHLRQVDERLGEIDHILEDQVEAITDWVAVIDGRILDVKQLAEATQQQIAAINDWSTSLEGRTNKLETKAEKSQKHVDAINDWVTVIDGRIRDGQERAKTTQHQIEAVNDWSTSLDDRATELETKADQTRKHVEAINDWVTNVDSHISRLDANGKQSRSDMRKSDEHLGQIDQQLEDQVEAINDWSTNLEGRTNKLETKAEQAQGQINQLANELKATGSKIQASETAFASLEAAQTEATSSETPKVATVELDEVRSQIGTQDQKIEAINDWSTNLDGEISKLNQNGEKSRDNLRQVDERLGQIDQQLEDQVEAINDWSTDLNNRTNELSGRTSELETKAAQSQRQIDQLRSEIQTVDSAPAVAAGIDTAGLSELNSQIGTQDQKIEAINDWSTNLDGEISKLNQNGEKSRDNLRQIDERLGQIDQQLEDQVEAINDWSTDLNNRTHGLSKRLGQTEHTLSELASELSADSRHATSTVVLDGHVADLQGAVSDLQKRFSQTADATEQQTLSARLEALERMTQDIDHTVQQWRSQQAESPQQSNDELRDILIFRIDSAEDRVDRRLANIEQSSSGSEQLEQMQRTIDEANANAQEALAFSENLRLLQTDLVQALRSEIEQQTRIIEKNQEQIRNMEAKLSHLM